jgi:hypothetical protein
MAETLIIEDDRFRLFLIPTTPHEHWINFRVKSARETGWRPLRSRLAYNRTEKRLSENSSTKSFRSKDKDALDGVVCLIERAVKEGLV